MMPQLRGSHVQKSNPCMTNFLTKITAALNDVALGYHTVRGISFLAVVFALALGVEEANAWNTVGVSVRLCRYYYLLSLLR